MNEESFNIMEKVILGSLESFKSGKISFTVFKIFLEDAPNIFKGNSLLFGKE